MAYLSPGVYVNEIDLSYYTAALATTLAGMSSSFPKGKVDELVYVSSYPNLIEKFGTQFGTHPFDSR
jgi:hypothetical protein